MKATLFSTKLGLGIAYLISSVIPFVSSAHASTFPHLADPRTLEAGIVCAQETELTERGFFPKNFSSLYSRTKHAVSTRVLEDDESLFIPGSGNLSEADFEALSNNHSYRAHRTLISLFNNHDFAGYSETISEFQKDALTQGVVITNAPDLADLSCFYLFTAKSELGLETDEHLSRSRALVGRVIKNGTISFADKIDHAEEQITDDLSKPIAAERTLHYDGDPNTFTMPNVTAPNPK
jgi:hypothetical protein